jgi:hypothetical protein
MGLMHFCCPEPAVGGPTITTTRITTRIITRITRITTIRIIRITTIIIITTTMGPSWAHQQHQSSYSANWVLRSEQ